MTRTTSNDRMAALGVCLLIFTGLPCPSAFAATSPNDGGQITTPGARPAGAGPVMLLAASRRTDKTPSARKRDFDHITTGFALSGAHIRVKCETCHVRGIFKGTPTTCAGCHDRSRLRASTSMPANHVPTIQPCDQCHNDRVWSGARYDHADVTPGACGTCHNNVIADGKSPGHIATTAACDVCHSTRAFTPATFDHSNVTPGTCATCHNSVTATGKSAGHVVTTASCDQCHSTRAWIPAGFDHSSVTPGTCATCHNGVTATGKSGGHVVTTASCDQCHSTRAWTPASFDHNNVVPGSCGGCHNGTTATGKSSGHFITSRSCDACHTTTRWTPATTYNHASAFFPGQHRSSVTCLACHTSNSEVIAWPFSAYKPDCAGCHANDFKSGPHKKTETPSTIYYTVSELRDCSGSCHIYTDNTFTSILRTRSGEHRTTGGEF